MSTEIRVAIDRDADIVTARQRGRDLAMQVGFAGSDLTVIATAISEVSRNIVSYAKHGEIILQIAEQNQRRGIVIIARDDGPGIANVEDAMRDGFSTARSLGLGLPGARRLMDDFALESTLGKGTTVTMSKWVR
ncbi:MAG: anti-sigma regulatory factor [Vicinamibacterales bacterium]